MLDSVTGYYGRSILCGSYSQRNWKSDIVVFIFSSHSNTSIQVIDELQKASSLNKTIIPFCVDRAMPSEPIEHYLSSPYKVDATIGLPDDNIAKLQNIIKQIYNQSSVHNANDINTVKDTFAPSNPLENNTNIIKMLRITTAKSQSNLTG